MQARKVIVVEDNDDIYNVITLILISKYYHLVVCPTAHSFYSEMGNGKPDLIIMDVMLPDGNGIALCAETKQSPLFKDVPILLMSAHLDPAIAKSSQANAFVKKPFDIDDFKMKVDALLDKN
ncbi:response regulator [Niabella insulamsoli]|uniref:response regulator n=1 Tax=Niabella insulamsoli TaxID=3144874 RepID=UPI0031FCD4C4